MRLVCGLYYGPWVPLRLYSVENPMNAFMFICSLIRRLPPDNGQRYRIHADEVCGRLDITKRLINCHS